MSGFGVDWSFQIPQDFEGRMAFRTALEAALVADLAATRLKVADENALPLDHPGVDSIVEMLADWWRLHVTSAEETEKLKQWWGK